MYKLKKTLSNLKENAESEIVWFTDYITNIDVMLKAVADAPTIPCPKCLAPLRDCSFLLEDKYKDFPIRGMHGCYDLDLHFGEMGFNSIEPCTSCEPSKPVEAPGFVYLMQSLHNDKNFKIGFSIHPEQRVKEVGDAVLIHTFPTASMREAEAKLHDHFKRQKLWGEWFVLYRSDIDFLKSVTGYEADIFITN